MSARTATSPDLRGVAVGAGYFSQFHYDAWARTPGAAVVAVCDRVDALAQRASERLGGVPVYTDVEAMLDAEAPDFIDIVTPPDSHLPITQLAAQRGVHVLCQKPLAPTFDEARALVEHAEAANVRLMVHENFRFQPWHRELRALIVRGAIGSLQAIAWRTRLGDGWGTDAYLVRQPYFRTMPRLLLFETGVHVIDVIRYLTGVHVRRVYAQLRRLNPGIVGEDRALVVLELDGDVLVTWDASRYHESLCADPRYTFGELLVEGDRGALRLGEDGRILHHPLGGSPRPHDYALDTGAVRGDSCYHTIRHFVACLRNGTPFETGGRDYLDTLAVQEALYRSASIGQVVSVPAGNP